MHVSSISSARNVWLNWHRVLAKAPENRPSPKRKVHLPTSFMGYLSFRHNHISVWQWQNKTLELASWQANSWPSKNPASQKTHHVPTSLAGINWFCMFFQTKTCTSHPKMPALGCIIMWYWLRLLGEPWPFIKCQHESLKGFALSLLGSMQAGLFHKIGTKKLRPWRFSNLFSQITTQKFCISATSGSNFCISWEGVTIPSCMPSRVWRCGGTT